MADKKQLKIIREGAQAWNQFRRDAELLEPDLSGADLSTADLSAVNLVSANLTNADFSEADLFGADLSRATLVGADLSRAILNKANFNHANLRAANIGGADLSHSNFSSADLRESHLGAANLNAAEFRNANLSGANLTGANLFAARFAGASLTDADFTGADCGQSDLSNADLGRSNLTAADLSEANLSGANLQGAKLVEAKLIESDLSRANLTGADLRRANFNGATLAGANLTGALLFGTTFGNNDLGVACGLDHVKHLGPSTLGLGTIFLSKGKIPEIFLRGAGIPEEFIRYVTSLHGSHAEGQRCFISYGREDANFARLLFDKLQERGVRCWLREYPFPHGDEGDHPIGLRSQLWEKVILCVSKTSIGGLWIDDEIRRALDQEAKILKDRCKKPVLLLPVDLDGFLLGPDRHAGVKPEIFARITANFAGWQKDASIFERELERVVAAISEKDQ
jgi:uncharacterized protein YjbI with pentapeptide repeats